MKFTYRLFLACGGLFLIVAGLLSLRRGIFSFTNASYHQTSFAAGAIGTGVLLVGLCFLPPGEWVYRHITTRRHSQPRPRRPVKKL